MIEIKEKRLCCGCESCVQICPKQCIEMKEDREGFRYPIVNKDVCVNCHICESVCPCLQKDKRKSHAPLYTYASYNDNASIRLNSSSGGIFTAIANLILDEKGVVFGALFNHEMQVCHDYVEKVDDLYKIRGTKYVQSLVSDSYVNVKKMLLQGRKVLFSGTPCQIQGLKNYLKKEYDNLFTVDVVCHGVPSPKIWREQLQRLFVDEKIFSINFRDKRTGWKSPSVLISSESHNYLVKGANDKYMNAFLLNLSIRPSCYNCPQKPLKSVSDLTLGDLWGVDKILPQLDDNKGTSLILVNTEKGKSLLDYLSLTLHSIVLDEAIKYNPSICKNSFLPVSRKYFWKTYDRLGLDKTLQEIKTNKFFRILNRIKRIIKR